MKTDYLTWYKDLLPEIQGREDIIPLISSSVDEPWTVFNRQMSDHFGKDLMQRLSEPNPWGLPALKELISSQYGINAQNIILTRGATNAIFLICQCLLEHGDEVLVETPCYEPLWKTPELVGAGVTFIDRREPDYSFSLKEIAEKVNKRTRLFILTNIHNPTCSFLSEDELLKILKIVRSKNKETKILVDEVYLDFIENRPPPSFLLDNGFITISSLTKVYGFSFLRCGWIAADKKILSKIRYDQVFVDGIGSRYLEALSTIVMENLDEYRTLSRNVVSKNRKVISEMFAPLLEEGKIYGSLPDAGCLYFPKIPGIKNTDALVGYLEKEHKVCIVPGRFFGKADHIRIGFGGSTNKLREGLKRFIKGLDVFMKQM